MNFDFDWMAAWHSKVVLAGGFVPVIAAIKERFTRAPADAANGGK